jgi:hypothetical protein
MTEKLNSPVSEKEALPTPMLEMAKSPEHPDTDVAALESDKNNLENIRAQVEKSSLLINETSVGERPSHNEAPMGLHRELKQNAYEQTLKRIQDQLRAPEKAFSRFIHQKSVEKISNAGAQTIARPSGILGGGILSLAGSALLLYATKRYGFEYNYFVFLILFAGGFAIGLIIEGLLRLKRREN